MISNNYLPSPVPSPMESLIFSILLIIYLAIDIIVPILHWISYKKLRELIYQNKDKIRLGFLLSHRFPIPPTGKIPNWQKKLIKKEKVNKKVHILLTFIYFLLTLVLPCLFGLFLPYPYFYEKFSFLLIIFSLLLFLLIVFVLSLKFLKKNILNEINRNINNTSH